MGVTGTSLRLVDRHPRHDVATLVESLVPPRRFSDVRFDTFLPDASHPSQAAARDGLVAFIADLVGQQAGRPVRPSPLSRLARRRHRPAPTGDATRGRYLDGGYGVGKTHLLAAAWYEATFNLVPSAYLTFAELTAIVGFLGMPAAIEAFAHFRLLCIDEFELDDVGNTLLAVTFLRAAVAKGGARVVTTSNSLPDRLGEGRFAADDFRREITAIADHFDVVRIDGPDYRARTRHEADCVAPDVAARVAGAALEGGAAVAVDDAVDVIGHLRSIHPVQYHALVDGLDLVVMENLRPLPNQGDALLFVHLVDELYDAGVPVVLEGRPIGDLFPETYRHGGYRKKYGRCESRLAALCAEAADSFCGPPA
jgi:cell division protein ZapE